MVKICSPVWVVLAEVEWNIPSQVARQRFLWSNCDGGLDFATAATTSPVPLAFQKTTGRFFKGRYANHVVAHDFWPEFRACFFFWLFVLMILVMIVIHIKLYISIDIVYYANDYQYIICIDVDKQYRSLLNLLCTDKFGLGRRKKTILPSELQPSSSSQDFSAACAMPTLAAWRLETLVIDISVQSCSQNPTQQCWA